MTAEELIAASFPPGFVGHACELGATDGVFLSNTLHLEQLGWKVLCIEGCPLYWERLAKCRKIVLPIAVSTEISVLPFAVWGRGGGYFASNSGLKQFPPVEGISSESKFVGAPEVPSLTLERCLEVVQFEKLDFLSLDVEGTELDVLKSMGRYMPRAIFVENVSGKEHIRDYLLPLGYERVGKTEQDESYRLKELE